MKEYINYYYNLNIDNLENYDTYSTFKINNKLYFFVPYIRGIDELSDIVNCSRELKEKGFNCHDIIVNKYLQLISKIDDRNYVLLCINGDINERFNIFDMIEINDKYILSNSKRELYKNNWANLWSEKIDYYEYQIRELGKDKKIILNSFSYYVGLSENAISCVNNTILNFQNIESARITLSHRRIFFPNIQLNYFNPLSFIFDLEVRDVAEYIKALFFYDDMEEALEELKLYFKLRKLTPFEYQMFFGRMLFPTYYFDIYEKVINNEILEDELLKIIDKSLEYELFLNQIYKIINQYYVIERIGWIKKEL